MNSEFRNRRRNFNNEERPSYQHHRKGFQSRFYGEETDGRAGWKAPTYGETFRNTNNKRKWQSELDDYEFEEVQSPGQPRKYTVSLAVPASILAETCVKDSLRTYVVGQLARAANIYSVDEVVVYDDQCWRSEKVNDSSRTSKEEMQEFMDMMRMLLEYQECPQYLRRHLFQFHPYLKYVGVLNALNSPHHLKANQWCEYREGVVVDKSMNTDTIPINPNKSLSYVDIGLWRDVSVNQALQPGLRVTVQLPPEAKEMKKPYGRVVSPSQPREQDGYYWGYTVRVADSLAEVVAGCRFPDGYDLLIGTSDKGQDVRQASFPPFSHALIVFGGVTGLENAIDADSSLEASEPHQLFDLYLNTCPLQQSRTVRTEEAVLITLTQLQHRLIQAQSD